MADTGFQLILNATAQVVGGTVTASDSHFYSGATAGDGSGVAGIKGCYSASPASIGSTPVGIVLPGPFTARLASQGEEDNTDDIRLLLLVARYDAKAQMTVLTPFRDSIPDIFRKHMSILGSAGVLYGWVSGGSPGIHAWDGIEYLAWEFKVTLDRAVSVTYAP